MNKYLSLNREKSDFPTTVDPSSMAPGSSSHESRETHHWTTRSNQTLPKQPAESGTSQDYVHHSQRRGYVGNFIIKTQTHGKNTKTTPRIQGEETPCRQVFHRGQSNQFGITGNQERPGIKHQAKQLGRR